MIPILHVEVWFLYGGDSFNILRLISPCLYKIPLNAKQVIFKGRSHTFKGNNPVVFLFNYLPVESTFKVKNLLLREQILYFKSRSCFGRDSLYWKANRKSQIFSPLAKMAVKYGSVPMHLSINLNKLS